MTVGLKACREKYEKFFYEPEVFVRAVNCVLVLRADGTREVIR